MQQQWLWNFVRHADTYLWFWHFTESLLIGFVLASRHLLLLHFLKKIDHCNTPFHRFSQNFPAHFLCKLVVPISVVETFLWSSWSLCMAWRFVCSHWQETPELSSTVLEQDSLSPPPLDHQSNYQKYCLAAAKHNKTRLFKIRSWQWSRSVFRNDLWRHHRIPYNSQPGSLSLLCSHHMFNSLSPVLPCPWLWLPHLLSFQLLPNSGDYTRIHPCKVCHFLIIWFHMSKLRHKINFCSPSENKH